MEMWLLWQNAKRQGLQDVTETPFNTPRIGYHAAAPGETAEDLWAHSCGDPECLHADSTCQGLLSPPLPPLFPVRMA